jgi:NAD+ synthase
MTESGTNGAELLSIDAASAVERIEVSVRQIVAEELGRRGLVVAMSGGVDSSVCAGLAVRALGAKRVFGLMLPEADVEPEAREIAEGWAKELGIDYAVEDITPVLEGCGCYSRRDDAIRRLVPDYGEGWSSKIVLPGDRLNSDQLNVYYLVVQDSQGETNRFRLPPREYREIVAATNFKQRARKMLEYHHADRLHYAVVGTPNRLEYDQGFFVKGGDGLADVKPIAHLYKTQVYQLAKFLGVPEAVTGRAPTTGTYSLAQTQEEFYFAVPTGAMDMMLFAHNNDWTAARTAEATGYEAVQVERVYSDIEQKRATTRYLHLPARLIEAVEEIE